MHKHAQTLTYDMQLVLARRAFLWDDGERFISTYSQKEKLQHVFADINFVRYSASASF